MPEEILDVQGIYKSFGNNVAAEDISFKLRPGEIMGLLGPNGAGKTTIIRMIMDIIKPDRGTVSYNFNSASGEGIKQRTGYLPEERGIVKEVVVLNVLLYVAALKGMPRQQALQQAEQYLELMGLTDYAHKKIQSLSKGMAQKVQFIMTILHDPDLLVLDEPLSGLDPLNQELFRDIIIDFRKRGKTILLSSHQMNLVEELCDRIFMINEGRQVLYGPLTEIKQKHANPLVNIYPGKGKELFLKHFPRAEESRPGWFRMELQQGEPGEFLRNLPDGVEVEELHLEQSSLHQIFIDKVREGSRK